MVRADSGTLAPVNERDYADIFDFRGASYNRACSEFPLAREEERRVLLRSLDLQSGSRFLDVPAGAGYLADGLLEKSDIDVTCVEPSKVFGQMIGDRFSVICSPIDDIPVESGSFDAIGSLAGLHHIEDRRPLFREWVRLLAPGGQLAVADVGLDSKTGDFLNGLVNRHTPQGHNGRFFAPGEFTGLMESAGLDGIQERSHTVHWRFQERDDAARFCRDLFFLQKLDELELGQALVDLLGLHWSAAERTWRLPWELVYARGKKPAPSPSA